MVNRRGGLQRTWIRIGGGVCGAMAAGALIPLVFDFRDGPGLAPGPGSGLGHGLGHGQGGRVDFFDEAWSLYASFRQTRMMAMAAPSGRLAGMLRALAAIALGCWIGRTLSAAVAEDAARGRKDVPPIASVRLPCDRGMLRRPQVGSIAAAMRAPPKKEYADARRQH